MNQPLLEFQIRESSGGPQLLHIHLAHTLQPRIDRFRYQQRIPTIESSNTFASPPIKQHIIYASGESRQHEVSSLSVQPTLVSEHGSMVNMETYTLVGVEVRRIQPAQLQGIFYE